MRDYLNSIDSILYLLLVQFYWDRACTSDEYLFIMIIYLDGT